MQSWLSKTTGRVKTEDAAETLRLEVVSSTIMYKGNASSPSLTSAAVWKLARFTLSSAGGIVIEYAGGVSTYTNVWDNRASASYS